MLTSSVRDFAVPLRTLDPDDPDVSDLAALRELIGDARVVAIGESAHGVREFYQLKDRILRFLVNELGFTAFVMESGFPEGFLVNDWVLGAAAGEAEAVARAGITFHFGECAEMRAQLQWMRGWNAAHERKVRFYGMDVAGSGTNPGPAVAACLRGLEQRPGDAELLASAELGEQFEALARYSAMTGAERDDLSKGIAELVDRARSAGNDVTYRCALNARCIDELLTASTQGSRDNRNPRDELMAFNVRWILEREPRIVISAHNGHVMRGPLRGAKMLGQFLDPVLRRDLVVIGTTYASGKVAAIKRSSNLDATDLALAELHAPSHTTDAWMESAGLPLHLVDLRRLPKEQLQGVTAMLVFHDAYDVDPWRAFDALVHVQHVDTSAEAYETLRQAMRMPPKREATPCG